MWDWILGSESAIHDGDAAGLQKFPNLIDGLLAESFDVFEFCCIPDLLAVVPDGGDGSKIGVLFPVAGVLVYLLHLLQFLADRVVGGEGVTAQG